MAIAENLISLADSEDRVEKVIFVFVRVQVNGSAFRDLCSGVLLGLSIGINITGVIITVSGIVKQKK